jgi:hypothetical protein
MDSLLNFHFPHRLRWGIIPTKKSALAKQESLKEKNGFSIKFPFSPPFTVGYNSHKKIGFSQTGKPKREKWILFIKWASPLV